MQSIAIQELVDKFHLEVVAGKEALSGAVVSDDIHRPGLEFTGYLDYFPNNRIQVLGRQEITYLHSLTEEQRDRRIGDVVARKPPCFIITRKQQGLDYMTLYCNRYRVPLLRTEQKTTSFISRLNAYLERELAPEQTLHAVCMNIFGVGVILRGESGIGKSEIALSLIERGHRLISDDIVILKKIGPETLIGTHNGNNREMLQLRGIGFIDVTRLFGSGSFQEETGIQLEIGLTPWDDFAETDLLGLTQKSVEYLETSIPQIEIPVRAGRNIAALVEVACKNWRLLQQGYSALDVFEQRVAAAM